MRKIYAKVIPHNKQRYNTPGDYWIDKKGDLQFRISDMHKSDYEFMVLIHELIEQYLCERLGITEEDIIKPFDLMYEKEREAGKHGDDEAGFDLRCPYRKQHAFATKIERLICKEMKVNWKKYDKTVMEL